MKTYYCNSSMKFNLDSMITLVQNLKYDFESGELTGEVEVCGKTIDAVSVYDLLEELYDLHGKALFGKVTGKEYGRIKEIQGERQMIRYAKCIAAGMSERDAGYAFTD